MAYNPLKYLNKNYDEGPKGLFARKGFYELSPEQKEKICNGAGPGGGGWWNRFLAWLIPDTLFGLDITHIANRHDFGYSVGGTKKQRFVEDLVFLINLMIWIWLQPKHRTKRSWLAFQYFIAVRLGGKKSFNFKVAP